MQTAVELSNCHGWQRQRTQWELKPVWTEFVVDLMGLKSSNRWDFSCIQMKGKCLQFDFCSDIQPWWKIDSGLSSNDFLFSPDIDEQYFIGQNMISELLSFYSAFLFTTIEWRHMNKNTMHSDISKVIYWAINVLSLTSEMQIWREKNNTQNLKWDKKTMNVEWEIFCCC